MKVWGISNEATQSTLIGEHAIEHGRVIRCIWSPNGEWIAFYQIADTGKDKEANKPTDTIFFIVHVWNAHTMSSIMSTSVNRGVTGVR